MGWRQSEGSHGSHSNLESSMHITEPDRFTRPALQGSDVLCCCNTSLLHTSSEVTEHFDSIPDTATIGIDPVVPCVWYSP